MFRHVNNDKGISLVEVALSIGIMAVVMSASYRLMRSYASQSEVVRQRYFISAAASAIKENAGLILSSTNTICTNITAAYADDGWGWRHPQCRNTSPFPVLASATAVLTYNIDTAAFTGIVGSIINNLSPFCKYTGQTATAVTFDCSALRIRGMQYRTSVAPSDNTIKDTVNVFTTPHTRGTSSDFLNFLDFPQAILIQYDEYLSATGQTRQHYDMTAATSDTSDDAYSLSLLDLYQQCIQTTQTGITALDTGLKDYAIGRMTTEFKNVAPNGLDSSDDFFIPWIWQAFADSQANSLTPCNNSTICDSIADDTVWEISGDVDTYAKAWTKITTNIFGSNMSYIIDGFGNPLRILLIANNCTGDVSGFAANQNRPPRPQQNYLNTMVSTGYTIRPPYTSLIVSPLCTGDGAYPDYCRHRIVYSN